MSSSQLREKGLSQFDGLKNVLSSLTSRLVTVEKDVNTCSAKVTELESNIQGVSNLFDNLKVECKKNKEHHSNRNPVLSFCSVLEAYSFRSRT
jgi:uncharacterized protein YoxC